jgi:hypothetical protein
MPEHPPPKTAVSLGHGRDLAEHDRGVAVQERDARQALARLERGRGSGAGARGERRGEEGQQGAGRCALAAFAASRWRCLRAPRSAAPRPHPLHPPTPCQPHLKVVHHQRLAGLEHDLGHLVGLERVGRVQLLAAGLLADLVFSGGWEGVKRRGWVSMGRGGGTARRRGGAAAGADAGATSAPPAGETLLLKPPRSGFRYAKPPARPLAPSS